MKYKVGLLILVLFLSRPTAAFSRADMGEVNEVFPLKKGNKWIYEGQVKWIPAGKESVLQKEVRLEMVVANVVDRGDIYAAILKGHPHDFVWYEEGVGCGDYLFVFLEGNYYFLEGERVVQAIARLQDEKDDLNNLVNKDELFLSKDLMYKDRDRGVDQALSQQNRNYEWFLKSVRQIDLKDLRLKGLASSVLKVQYNLIFQTLPDDTTIEFVPGIGITQYKYIHHGAVAETDLRLIEFVAN